MLMRRRIQFRTPSLFSALISRWGILMGPRLDKTRSGPMLVATSGSCRVEPIAPELPYSLVFATPELSYRVFLQPILAQQGTTIR